MLCTYSVSYTYIAHVYSKHATDTLCVRQSVYVWYDYGAMELIKQQLAPVKKLGLATASSPSFSPFSRAYIGK